MTYAASAAAGLQGHRAGWVTPGHPEMPHARAALLFSRAHHTTLPSDEMIGKCRRMRGDFGVVLYVFFFLVRSAVVLEGGAV